MEVHQKEVHILVSVLFADPDKNASGNYKVVIKNTFFEEGNHSCFLGDSNKANKLFGMFFTALIGLLRLRGQ